MSPFGGRIGIERGRESSRIRPRRCGIRQRTARATARDRPYGRGLTFSHVRPREYGIRQHTARATDSLPYGEDLRSRTIPNSEFRIPNCPVPSSPKN